MTSTNDILAQIDSTLDDWTVSGDAMRSRPPDEDEPEPFHFGGATPTLYIADEASEWQQVEGVVSVEVCVNIPDVFEEAAEAWVQITERIRQAELERARQAQAVLQAFVAAYVEAIKPAVEAAGAAFAEFSRTTEQAGHDNFQHLPEAEGCTDCTPPPSRDRPAWQSPYGPARRRR